MTRLNGQAYAFYRACTPPQRSSYEALVGELTKRFTPVRIQAIESSLFHERKQKPNETVDAYAQDLRMLFNRAYPLARQGTSEAQAMGQSVLAYQFVSGLGPKMKAKVAGTEGSFEQLLVKARFEEVKLRDLEEPVSRGGPTSSKSSFTTPSTARPRVWFTPNREARGSPGREASHGSASNQSRPTNECYNCGSRTHFARQCPHRGRARPSETPGRSQGPSCPAVAKIASDQADPGSTNQGLERVAEIRRQLEEAELQEALTRRSATMHGIQSEGASGIAQLGPTPMADVELEGSQTRALLDTGSPVTIVSLQFLLDALAKQRPEGQSPENWIAAVEERLEPSSVTLHNYGGQKLGIIRQIRVRVARPGCSVEAVVQVQNGAPTNLLIGTDLLPQLGFIFLQTEPNGEDLDLLQVKENCAPEDKVTQRSDPMPPHPNTDKDEQSNPELSILPGVVCLIQATRLPARHMKMVRAKVSGYTHKTPVLFEPEVELLRVRGLSMADAMTEPGVDNCVTLILQNESHEPIYLDKDQVLGKLSPGRGAHTS